MSDVIDLSRIQFGFTVAYHFLFVPLTLGLMALIALMEGAHLLTGNASWREAARFWGKFFLINFVFGIATGYPLRMQLRSNWESYSEYVRDGFASVFSFENAVAPILFGLVVLFALGWRMRPVHHFLTSAALAVVLIVQSSGILLLNAWMQNPVGVDALATRAPTLELGDLLGNPLAPAKIMHTVAAAYALGSVFVIAISAWYLLHHRHLDVARRSLRLGACFGLGALLVTVAMGHWSGELLVRYQPMKFAAIEAMWETEPPPAGLTAFAWPDMETSSNRFALKVPYVLGLIAAEDRRTPIAGIHDLVNEAERKIRLDLERRASGRGGPYGYAALLPDGVRPSPERIAAAARSAVPAVPVVFTAFRVMVGCGLLLIGLLALVVLQRPDLDPRGRRRLLWLCVLFLPLPWIATDAGWVVCEVGRQPWTIAGILPTARSAGALEAGQVAGTLMHFSAAYAILFVLNVALNVNSVRRGPGVQPFRWPGIDWIPALRPAFSASGPVRDPTTGFRAALSRRGIIVPRDVIADGRVHRCDAEGRFGHGAAVYSLHLGGVPVGGFRNWRDNLGWELWQASVGRPLRTGEQVAQQLKAEAIQHALEVEELERRAQVLRRAAEIFKAAEPATSNHPYLRRKRVGAHGLQVRAGTLIVPVRDPDDELRSLQFIREGAGKKFLIGGTVEGCYFAIGKPDGVLCVAEDYATGASIFEATGYAVAVAFSAKNLEPVARALRVKFPRIRLVVCADDDADKTGNPGLTHAIAAARAVGALLAVPDFGPDRPRHATNFNDLHRARGHDAVKRAISPAQGLIDLADRQAAAGYLSAATAN